MKVYYAHFKGIYNTLREAKDLDILRKLFPNADIINPNSSEHASAYKNDGMKHFTDIVKSSDCVVFRALSNGKITAGVWQEIKVAKDNHIPVIELPNLINRKLSVKKTRHIFNEHYKSNIL